MESIDINWFPLFSEQETGSEELDFEKSENDLVS